MTETNGMPDDLAAILGRWEQQDREHWSNWRVKAKESYAFVASDQYTAEQRSALEEDEKMPATINRIGPMINAVAGAEIIDRQQVQYIPRTTGDAGVNEILTQAADYFRDQTRADREESDAFRDALICGLGYTETVMNYDDGPEGKIVIQRIDPIEVTPHCSARKANLADAHRFHRKRRIGLTEFEAMWPDASPSSSTGFVGYSGWNRPNRDMYKPHAYSDDADRVADDEVELVEWQWFDFEVVFLAVSPDGEMVELSAAEHEEGQRLGAITQSVRQRRKRYYRALCCGDQVLEYGPLPDGSFTIKAITGERDRNKGTFFGVVEAMKDPQRFANMFFSMLHHIIRTNAKGGILAELDAFVDPKEAQDSWAKSDEITWLAPGGALKIKPKDAPQIPPQISQLLQFSVSSIKDASGINEELLGLVGRDQPGVLEHQRKQAAYAILAGYYDSLRFYRIEQGELLLKYMQRYIPDGTLIRIIGEDGDPRFVPLIKQPDTIKFDVIVDEAPAGPNQKQQVWSIISQMQAVLAQTGPEIWAELIEYSPLPDKVNRSIKGVLQQQSQPKPPDPLAVAKAQAALGKDQASAAKDNADAQQTNVETQIMLRPPPITALFGQQSQAFGG